MNSEYYKYILVTVVIFSLGWISADAYGIISSLNFEKPLSITDNELASPSNWVKEDQITIYNDYVKINIKNASWARFADTNSMDPLLDKDSNSIKITPKDPSDLQAGDIISYKAEFTTGMVIHRITKIDYDEEGWYATAKGDNNRYNDPDKIRFNQITGVLVGIIY